jgi:hypothetical protein
VICTRCKASGIKTIPQLKAHHKSDECRHKDPWFKIIEARQAGKQGLVDKLIRKALGISKPMSEATKERLKEYNKENRDDVKLKRKQKRMFHTRFKVHNSPKPKTDDGEDDHQITRKPVARKRTK